MAAGAIAQKALSGDNLQITTYVDRIHDIECPTINEIPTLEQIEASPTRCPHPETVLKKMEERILELKKAEIQWVESIICRKWTPRRTGGPSF